MPKLEPRLRTHVIDRASYPPFRTRLPALISCVCGWEQAVTPNMALPDPFEGVKTAFGRHRSANDLSPGANTSIGRSGEYVTRRWSIKEAK